ncbi:hypothetical protein C5Q97_00165 [Victivallales bacterium CCUG 44730]|nr:hypothetical protein C5Q97_00165 [Victivallales bacterium CCUG 44730]
MKATTTPVLGIQPCEYDRSRTYGWNGENRLISAENGDTRLEFSYDYMGRRFEKKVYSANVLTKHEKFVYDGYKLIQVLDALNDNAVTMTFVWHPESTGLDTPFSMTYNGEIYYYVTDGNKNVTALLDADGNRAAEYIYHPFGTIYSKTGPMVDLNPFRFSSEYHDDETGLVYYNYRYYSPELGRWISRDPIEEEGGVNLYAMVGNNPVNKFDRFGFSSFDILYEMFNMSPGAVPPYSPVTKGGCCGKDVTKKLNSLLNNVKKRLSTLNNKLLLTSNPSMFFPGDGWDIWEFYQNDVRLTKGSYGEDCELTVAYNGHCVKMTSLNYVLWGLLASIKDNAFGGSSVSSSFAHLAFATAYAAYKAENNDENEAAATAFWGRVGFSLAGMQFYHTGNIDVWDVLDFTSCKVKPNNEYTGKLTAHIRYGFSSSSFLEIVSD